MQNISTRFWNKVRTVGNTTECWLWTGPLSIGGYGVFKLTHPRKNEYAHRTAYRLTFGWIPSGLELDHLCTVRDCVNPWHLEPVTHAENVRRSDAGRFISAIQSNKTHCPLGHEYSAENTYRPRPSHRVCRECDRRRGREYRARKKLVLTAVVPCQIMTNCGI